MKKKARLDEIYDLSASLFAQKGYDAVTIDEICAASGITKPTFYARHLTKAELLCHAFQPKAEDMFREKRTCNPDNLLQEIYDSVDLIILKTFRLGPDLLRSLLQVQLCDPDVDEFIESEWLDYLEELIVQAAARHQIESQDSPKELTRMICMYILGYSFQYCISSAEENRYNLHEGIRIILQAPKTGDTP